MLRSSFTALGVVLLGATALAQNDLSSRVHPITSPVKNAGTLNLATGQWTRATNGQALVAGAHIVYANTCDSGYYGGMMATENWTDEGTIPNQDMIQTPSLSIPGGFDTERGCEASYNINGFQIGYCTYQAVPFSCTIKFFDVYQIWPTFCTPKPAVATASFLITGLPATSVQLTQACWLVGFDLTGGTPPGNFTLTGTNDPNGVPPAPAPNEQFGWSFVLNGASDAALPDGTILAGGVAGAGSPFTCTGVDATRWDIRGFAPTWPANVQAGPVIPASQEQGSGMLNSDAFRTEGPTFAPSGPGCYYFGTNPNASFHLELYSDVACPGEVGSLYCRPSTGCPCGPPVTLHAGCNNGQATGGALLTASLNGTAVEAVVGNPQDQVQLNLSSAPPGVLSFFFQGNSTIGPLANQNGFLCVSQTIRLNGAPGTVGPHDQTSAGGTLSFPHAAPHNLSISAQSALVGAPISPGQKRFYQVAYRDTVGGVGVCPGGFTVNWSNAVEIQWH